MVDSPPIPSKALGSAPDFRLVSVPNRNLPRNLDAHSFEFLAEFISARSRGYLSLFPGLPHSRNRQYLDNLIKNGVSLLDKGLDNQEHESLGILYFGI